MNDARKKIAKTLKVQEKEIIFTSGGTESNNLAILGAAEANKRSGMHVITTAIEHPSVSNAMACLEKQGYEVTYLPVDACGEISPEALRAAIRPDTILVSMMQVNNEIGAIEPIAEAGSLIKEVNPQTLFHVDAIQAYGKMRILPGKMKIDLLSVSGHKIHGPKGSGFLYIKDRTKIQPILNGGGQQRGMRSGTENVPAIAGLGVAAEAAYGKLEENVAHLYALRAHFIGEVQRIDGVTVNGHLDQKNAPHIVSVSIDGVRAEVMLHALEDRQVYVSAGSACSSNKPSVSRTLQGIGIRQELLDATIRFSFCVDTTMEEIDYALDVMRELVPMLQKYTRH
jgi:cysteine desulfurase